MVAIIIANVVEGDPLVRIGAALISSQCLRLLLLVLSYPRSFARFLVKLAP